MADNPNEERFEVKGEDLVKRVKELIKQGNIRRIIVKDKENKVLIEFPLTVGIVGTVLWCPHLRLLEHWQRL